MNISIVIVTGNRDRLLCRLLRELLQQSHKSIEVVVVIGPGSQATWQAVKEIPCNLKTVSCPVKNIARARNTGAQKAAGELVGFIDDDAMPASKNWAAGFSDFFEKDTSCAYAAAGGQVLYRDSSVEEFHDHNNTVNDYGQFAVPGLNMNNAMVSSRWVLRVPGCNAFFRRSGLEQVKGFDEAYRYYHDETDICFRLNKVGIKTAYLENSAARHYDAKEERPLLYRRPWRNIAFSDAYYCMKNALDPLPEKIVKTLRSLPARHYVKEAQIAETQGRTSSSEAKKVHRLLVKGWTSGIFTGLLKKRTLPRFEVKPDNFTDFRK